MDFSGKSIDNLLIYLRGLNFQNPPLNWKFESFQSLSKLNSNLGVKMAIIFSPYGMLVGQFFSNFTVVIGMSFELDYLLNHKNRDAERSYLLIITFPWSTFTLEKIKLTVGYRDNNLLKVYKSINLYQVVIVCRYICQLTMGRARLPEIKSFDC